MDRPHDATADAIASVEVLFAMAVRHDLLRLGGLRRLHAAQVGWHRDWAAAYDAGRREQGQVSIDPREFLWPLAPAVLPPAAA